MKPPSTNRRWIIFALACGTSFVLYLHRYTWNFISPMLGQQYGFNETQLGTLGSLFHWTYGSLQIPSGMVADFFGPHVFLGLIIAVWSLTLSLHGASGDFRILGAVRLLFGMGQAGAYPSLSRVTHAWFPKRTRTIVQGWVATFFGRGGGFASSVLLGTVLMGWLELSWQLSLILMSSVGLVLSVLFLWLFHNDPAQDPHVNDAELALIHEGRVVAAGGETRNVLPWRRAAASGTMWLFVVQQFFNAGADNIYSLFMGGYFLKVKGVDITQAGFLVGLPLLGGAVGGMLGGYCNDALIRWTGRRWARSIMGFTGKALACWLMFLAIAQEDATAAGWSLFVVKFFSDWTQPTVWGACTDIGGRYSGSVFSIINTSGTLGGVICPPLFGWILDHWAYQSAGRVIPGYHVLFPVVAGMYIATAVCWLAINCSHSLDEQEKP